VWTGKFLNPEVKKSCGLKNIRIRVDRASVQKQNNKQVIANDLKSKSVSLSVLCNDILCFRPAKKYHFSLHWDCIPFFVKYKVKNQCKTDSKTSKTIGKDATKENNNDVKR